MAWGEPPKGPPQLEQGDSPGHPLSPWFAYKRRLRRDHYAARDAEPRRDRRRAVMTMVRNEPIFLPIWLGYYSRYFDPEDIYVLDHDSTDGSTSGEGFVRIPVSHDTVDMSWMVGTVEEHQRRLLESYDVVVAVEVDEIIAPNPAWGTLADYLARFDEEWVNCLGYEVLHKKDEEPPFRPDESVLEQRRYWYPNDLYDKPSIATVPLRWKPGFHARADNQFNFDPDLRLIHLHRMDYGICKARHDGRRLRKWNPRDVEAGWGNQNLITDDADFERWFYEDSNFEGIPIVLEEIPAAWRQVV